MSKKRNLSTLYPVPPKAYNGQYETVTGYLTRLAHEHVVSVRTLFFDTINHVFDRQYLISQERPKSTTFWLNNSRMLFGMGEWASDIITALQKLTSNRLLGNLTLLKFRPLLGNRKLIKSHLAWCPSCFSEWTSMGQPILQLIYWQIQSVRVCAWHHQILRNRCPNCRKEIPYLTPNMALGFCPYCNADLTKETTDQKGFGTNDIDQEIWVSKMVCGLLNEANATVRLDADTLAKSTQICLQKFAGNSISKLAAICDVGKTSVRDWLKGKQKILLPTLLNLCGKLQIEPAPLIFNNRIIYSHIEYRNNETQSQKESSFDLFRLKKGIDQALASKEHPPPNMVTVAARLEHDRSHLYRLFPNECKAIAKRARDFHHRVHEEKLRSHCKEVEQAIKICRNLNIHPSEREVKKILKKPGIMRHPQVRERFEKLTNTKSERAW